MKIPRLKPNLPLALSLAMGLLLPAFAAAQDQTPLGTVARQHKAQGKAKRVITDEDMATRASERGPSPNAAQNDSDTKTTPGADKADKTDKTDKSEDKSKSETTTASSTPESEDSPAAAPIRRKLNNLKQLAGLLEKKIDEVQQAMANDSDPDHKSGYQETMEANKKSLASTREQITATEKELAEANK